MYSLTNHVSIDTYGDLAISPEYYVGMELKQRIFQARTEAKMTQKQLGKAVGKTRAAVAQWEAGDVRPRHSTLQAIATATNRSIDWLVSGIGENQSGIPVIGNVAAGVWLESAAHYEQKHMPVAPHPSYPLETQRLWYVQGNSCNKIVDDGEYVHSVDVMGADLTPRHGDLVIVRRTEHERSEYTLKRVYQVNGSWELHPESNDPEWQETVVLNGDDSTEIAIVDIVIAKWSPINRGG